MLIFSANFNINVMIKYRVKLTADERKELEAIVNKGSHKSQKALNSLILLKVDEGQPKESRSTNEKISNVLKISMKKIDRVKKKFVEEGMETALCGHSKEREYERKVDGDLEAKLTALACSEVPEGFACRSLRMPADRVFELEYVDSISHETVRRTLKKTD